jgi:hypothetical protein
MSLTEILIRLIAWTTLLPAAGRQSSNSHWPGCRRPVASSPRRFLFFWRRRFSVFRRATAPAPAGLRIRAPP